MDTVHWDQMECGTADCAIVRRLMFYCGFGHKVKLAHQWVQQLMRTSRSLNEILFGHNLKFSQSKTCFQAFR